MIDRMTMAAVWKADELTPFPFEQAVVAMKYGLQSQLTPAVREDVLALALAKTALETGNWKKIHQYNWGNIKAGQQFEGQYTTFTCGENYALNGGPSRQYIFHPEDGFDPADAHCIPNSKFPATPNPSGNPQTRFRAYANEYDGAIEYVEFVANGRYHDAWNELLEGDASGYVHALKLKGYFTADEHQYAAGVIALQKQFVQKLKGLAPTNEVNHDDAFFEHISRIVASQYSNLLEIGPHAAKDLSDTEPSPPPDEPVA